MLVTVMFEDHEGRTKVTLRTEFGSAADLAAAGEMGAVQGAIETLDRLEEYVATA